jgi:hypothetical protein
MVRLFTSFGSGLSQSYATPVNSGSFTRLFAESFPYGIVNN